MDQVALARLIASSLVPVLRHTAHQLTLLGLVQDEEDFSVCWLGSEGAYHRFRGFDLLELGGMVHSLEFGIGLQTCAYEDDWEKAKSDKERWQAKVRLAAMRSLKAKLRVWAREHGWQGVDLN